MSQFDQTCEKGGIRVHVVPELSDPLTALRRQAQLVPARHHQTPLKSEVPENVNADRRGEIVVTGHLSSLVTGERHASLDRNPFDQLDATGENARGVVSLGKVANQIEPAGPVDERHDGRGSPCTDDEVSLEVADLAPGPGDLGPQTDQVEGTQWACLLLRRLTGSTPTLATTPLTVQAVRQARGQSSGAVAVDGLVDRFRGHRVPGDPPGSC